jgi:replicative DNA helicase
MSTNGPHNPEVEAALVGRLLREPALTGEVVGTLLEPQHFRAAASRTLYAAIVEQFFADEPVEPLVIGELNAKTLSTLWHVDERTAVARVIELADRAQGSPLEAAKLVKRDADYRALLQIADNVRDRVQVEQDSPEEIAGIMGQAALQVASSGIQSQEIVSFADAGRAFVRDIRVAQAARQAGVELGAYFGLHAIDAYVRGLRPTELLIGGGEPGVGKSAVWWRAGLSFAERQAKRPPERQVGTMIVSLEMGPTPSNARFASMLGRVSGIDIREGTLSARDLQKIIDAWRQHTEVPLWLNYAPTLRASQLRALVSEAIRRHNVGLVILDHFRMWDLDVRLPNKIDEDEEKVRFLKEQIASSLNVAVVCLAHTRKPDPGSNGRPRMADLRGSYQVAAHSDLVSFIYRPAMYATRADIEKGEIRDTDAEMIWAKNRHGTLGAPKFFFDAERMFVADLME